MERQTKILDASIIVKWFSEEEQSEKAIALRDEYLLKKTNLAVSEITFLEVLNALRYKKKNEEEIKKANTALWNLQMEILKTDDILLNKAIGISLKHNLTMYDAVYVALAEVHNATLITADEALSKVPNTLLLKNL